MRSSGPERSDEVLENNNGNNRDVRPALAQALGEDPDAITARTAIGR